MTRSLAFAFAFACVAGALLSACQSHPSLDVAPNVDLGRFQGKWYEVAKLPRPTQADCTGTTAFYTLGGDGALSVVNECKLGSLSGPLRAANATAKVTDPAVPAKLSLDFGLGIYGDYWILEVGDQYQYALVGHPTRQYLWILSRTPTLDKPTLDHVLATAEGASFDTSKLEYTTQGAATASTAPESSPADRVDPKVGCATSPGRRGAGAGSVVVALAALARVIRRRRER